MSTCSRVPIVRRVSFRHVDRFKLLYLYRVMMHRQSVKSMRVSVMALVISLLTGYSVESYAQRTQDPAARTTGEDWGTFLGPRGDSKSTESNVLLDWPVGGPPLAWECPLGESYGIGSISQGRYFQFDYRQGKALLLCLNSETGKRLWQFAYSSEYVDLYDFSSGPRTTPVVDGDRVYIYGAEGRLHCLRVSDGALLWKVDTRKKFGVVQNFFGVGSTPAIYQDLLIVMVGGSPAADAQLPPGRLDLASGNGSGVVAFDKLTGKVQYRLSDDLASYASPRIVHHSGRAWCFAFLRGGLLAFDPSNGVEDFYFPWRAKILESVNASTPAVWGPHVLISETYGPGAAVIKFSSGRPEVLWSDQDRRRDKSLQTHLNTSIIVSGYIYGSSGRHTQNAELRCVEAATGKVIWSQPGLTRSSLLYVDGHFICLSEYGTLRVLRATPERYHVVSEFTPTEGNDPARPLLKYPAWAAPILSHGRLYVRGKDRMVCYDLSRTP